MSYILLVVSILMNACRSIFTKKLKIDFKNIRSMSNANIFIFSASFITVYVIHIINNSFYLEVPLLLALAYAVSTLLAQISLIIAVEKGPVSISTLFYSCGFIIPTIWGCIAYSEEIKVMQIIGIVMIIISFILSIKVEDSKKINRIWLLAAISGFVFSGIIGVVQKNLLKITHHVH